MPHGVSLEYFATGTGEPTTVFAHGLAGGIPDTRPLGSGVAGRKVFFQFRGHGRSDQPTRPVTYVDLAADLRAVADKFDATRALGVSLGAGALCRLLAQTPDRFERVVFFLPSVLDEPRPPTAMARVRALLEAVEANDAPTAATLLSAEIPPALRDQPAAWRYIRERLDALDAGRTLPGAVRPARPGGAARPQRARRGHRRSALVIGCRGDEAHPAATAQALAAALPRATLHVYDQPAVLWNHRTDLRARISEFLNDPPPTGQPAASSDAIAD